MTNSLDILIKFLIDKSAQAQTEQGTKQVASELGDVDKAVKALDKTFEQLEAQMKQATSVKDFESLERQLKDVEDQVKDTTDAYRLQAKLLRAEAAQLTSDFEKARLSQLKNIGGLIGSLSTAGLGLGVGLVGGIFAAASKYVEDAEEATRVTMQWKTAQDSLARSGERIGAVFAEQALPLLKDAAQLAQQAAGFIESHPELVRAALEVGKWTVALSAIGTLVQKGIALYADAKAIALGIQEMAAAKLQDAAADKQFAAAQLQAGVAKPGPTKGIGGAADLLLPLLAIITGFKIFSAIGRGAANFGARQFGFESPEAFWQEMLESLHLVKASADDTAGSLKGTAGAIKGVASVASLGGDLSTSSHQDELLRAYEKYRQDDLKLVQDHYADRARITADSLKAEQNANAQFAASSARILSQMSSALSQAASDFARANAQAEARYNEQRAQIIRDGGIEIQRIEEQLQERLRQLAEDHAQRSEDLTAARDALGLTKENRRYQQERDQEIRNTNAEIRQRRQDIALRLEDLQRSYEQERAERLADYNARVAEIKANADQQLAELAAQHAEELRQIREQRAARLQEADQQFRDERQRRYEYFVQQIRDLDASLLGEKNLRAQYHTLMLQDLESFLSSYRAGLSTLSPTPAATRATGGYAAYGTYLLGDRRGGGPGKPEYVIEGNTTQMLERLLGSQITPERLLSAVIYGGGSVSRSAVYNDNRRMDGRISGADRNRIVSDTLSAFDRLLEGMS